MGYVYIVVMLITIVTSWAFLAKLGSMRLKREGVMTRNEQALSYDVEVIRNLSPSDKKWLQENYGITSEE